MDIRKQVTIYDIAKEAGVSVSTVSRVLTSNANVSKEKKEKVERLIEKYDYKPNALARGLSETKSNVIGIIASDIRNPFYATLFVECEKAANEYGYRVVLCNSLNIKQLEDLQLENLESQRVEAIVQIGGRVDELISDSNYVERVNRIANKIPIIITGKLDGADCYQVNLDEGKSMEIMLEYLISSGHKEIALIGGSKDVKSTVEKQFRFKQVLSRYGIKYREEYIIEGNNYDDSGGYNGMQQLFELGDLPSAIMAINDFTAVGIIRAITQRGMSIPQDISVVSFDNTFLSDLTIPRLTGIDYNYEKFGQKIIETAVGAIKGEDVARISLIESKLVIKESCININQ
ncbi:LacI family transcriptional regulator [Lachnotalea glycerini]|jgi:LacI family transcriptional regulator|uniref:LacI family transcriptional regulator n=1 Tax=Lachnotalea glycerini TaxID=1763509 RepID=A0A255IP97_9FIRM|nr:LacI family DNA-binding transcriptional regulator [Lachnotalea glycerini]PXV91584.1 LacI family transcriptional regulator [Lachnotalea glycerini]RDY30027.1 LacI family transcriptional regulator [Lachnotalea glycerini]